MPDATSSVNGVLYRLPWLLSDRLDAWEDVPSRGYQPETVEVNSNGRLHKDVRTYVVVNKSTEEIPPSDWYSQVVFRGAVTCGLPEQYCWQLFNHIYQLQKRQTIKN